MEEPGDSCEEHGDSVQEPGDVEEEPGITTKFISNGTNFCLKLH